MNPGDEERPPPFEEATNDQPPSYDSIYGKIKHAKAESDGPGQFMRSVCSIVLNSIGFTIMVAIMMLLPVTTIVIGVLNLENCPAQRFIPIWLVVAGSVSALMQLVTVFIKIKAKCSGVEEEEVKQNRAYTCFNSLTGCFNLAWFIAGNVWVYGMYPPDNTSDATGDDYCDHTAYYFAFALITLVYVILALVCCCACCCVALFAKK